ncbi:MAG: alpha-mannosidase [Aphanothece sp. CMT-3BRIN-NPC111]|nr:alpha-mannosidase [Aphanothece sp. CMT-3BRIN-NPC111]
MTHPAAIITAIDKLRQLTQVNVQTCWKYCAADLTIATATQSDLSNWQVVQLNAKGHIAWEAGRQVLWLGQKFVIPQHLQGYPLAGLVLRLALRWWAQEAQIFINGQLVQEGDLFDCSTRILLSPSVTPGEEITVTLRLVSPGHDMGALVHSQLVYEAASDGRRPAFGDRGLEPGFIADELAVLQQYLSTFAPEKLDFLAAAVAEIDWEALPDHQTFERSLFTLRQNLLQTQNSKLKTQNSIHLVGHAHLDMAWLWPISETWEVAQRTFESVLKLSQEFPDLIFCHSTPALYAWIEEHRPDLFTAIQEQVASGHWEIVGGMWVEPELNLIAGESIVRQVLYGQRYVQAKFGQLSTVAWLPDSFGFCATLPQILKQGGIEYFVTQKLLWNDTTQFPYGTFLWQSPDGTQIFSLMSALIGESIEPIKMASYACDWEKQTLLKDSLWLPGVGDHGGGPTRDMLEVAQRWQQSPFFPHLKFTTAAAYLQHISNTSPSAPLPIWNDELYLEFHRGCYTSHADQKRWNRECEELLYQAELFASLATISVGTPYPQAELEDAWKKVLFNQFHDILPGTSIPEVFVEVNQAWQEAEQVGKEILETATRAIASQIILPPPPQPNARPIIIFNSLNWQRSEVVALSLPTPQSGVSWQIYDLAGQQLPSQLSEGTTLLFLATDIPSVGYRLFWLCPQEAVTVDNTTSNPRKGTKSQEHWHNKTSISLFDSHSEEGKIFTEKDWVLENELLRVTVDFKTGDLCSVFDKIHSREILNNTGGNELQAFQDSGQYWDAWNIDPNYAQHPLSATKLKSIQWIEQGPLQQRLRVVRQLGQSEFCQDYVLSANSPILKIATTVDWQERHVLVKAAFPLNLEADYATYEIPCGAIKRPTQPKNPAEQAKWEVPALHWADLSNHPPADAEKHEDDYGVSLLNDCKYGYDCQPQQLRLTLLRSPIWPDPEADQGIHEFTYALYPHSGSWQSAQTVRRGYELNLPLQVMLLPSLGENRGSLLPAVGQLLNLPAENLILMAFKQSEDNPQQWILRCYECHGEEAKLRLESDLGLSLAQEVDLLERPVTLPDLSPDGQTFKIQPWKISSFVVVGAE